MNAHVIVPDCCRLPLVRRATLLTMAVLGFCLRSSPLPAFEGEARPTLQDLVPQMNLREMAAPMPSVLESKTSEPKRLKLAFAMGGGVSLGAFSGAALTEAIKLALLRIAEAKLRNEPLMYDRVEVDVFCGASAGSLSLAVMLRALTWRTQKEIDTAVQTLQKDYPKLWTTIAANEDLKQGLIAAQVAQDLQSRAWVSGIGMKQLLGDDNPARKEALRHSPGLLDAEAVYGLARELLIEGLNDPGTEFKPRLLANPSIYACTLTSLTPLTVDARKAFAADPSSLPGLRDALVSRFHNDMRVFEINFAQAQGTSLRQEVRESMKAVIQLSELAPVAQAVSEAFNVSAHVARKMPDIASVTRPPRWFRIAPAANGDNGAASEPKVWALRAPRTWSTLSATAIASGAFPGAFPPAVLERHSYEYGWRKGMSLDSGVWPKELKEKEADAHPFAYVDGGVFNNDPVRQAFRIVSYVDGKETKNDFIRRVLYVDPSVGPEDTVFRLPALVEYETGKAELLNIWQAAPTKDRPTLSRLLGQITGLISIIVEQGRTREADAAWSIRDAQALRRSFRAGAGIVADSISIEYAQAVWQRLNAGSLALLATWEKQMIPAGVADQQGGMRRVLRELGLNHLLPMVDDFVKEGPASTALAGTRVQDWIHAHLCLYYDLLLDLEGVDDSAVLIAITPYEKLELPNPVPLKLLGDPISAFAGFFSKAAREHDAQAGRFCAGLFLADDAQKVEPGGVKRVRLLPESETARVKAPNKQQGKTSLGEPLRAAYTAEMKLWAPKLRDRVEQAIKDGLPVIVDQLVLTGANKPLTSFFEAGIDEIIAERFSPPSRDLAGKSLAEEIELFILTPPDLEGLELAQKGLGFFDEKVRSKRVFGAYHNLLVTRIKPVLGDKGAFAWEGGAVRGGMQLRLDRGGLNFGPWATVQLPSGKAWEDLHRKSITCLRPVLKLDLRKLTSAGGHHVPEGQIKWEIAEGAETLVDILLIPPKPE